MGYLRQAALRMEQRDMITLSDAWKWLEKQYHC
jgi:ABC-type Zn uptake system ZnuABC Zn-binding protein ZnuA